ncbi:MAG: response regulator [Candidatus Rokubacteria bacterium]|nr:response regulator [Candidatus Rokubacteria bacterium]
MQPTKPIDILLVEDNVDHAELTRRALETGNMLNDVHWVKDGAEALDFLFHRGAYANGAKAPRPGLILLDIKLPKVDGLNVLREIKSSPALRTIPVIMLTTSAENGDVNAAYAAGANSFVTKPISFREFVERIQAVKLYWVLTNVLGD